MVQLSFKTKILMLELIPLVLVSIAVTTLAIFQATELGANNLRLFKEKIYDSRRAELKNYVELALTAVDHVYKGDAKFKPESQETAKTIFRNLRYGSDGYIFVYDYEGTNLVLPTKPHVEGKNLWDMQDKNGVYVIQGLIEGAKIGGGFTDYVWHQPSKGTETDKISFTNGLQEWQWMVGTGLYVDDLEDWIAGVQNEISKNITRTLSLIGFTALMCTAVVAVLGARFTVSQGKLADEKLQTLSVKAVASQEEERSRVARELQKGINQTLVAAREKIDKILNDKSIDNADLKNDLNVAAASLKSTIKEVFRISGELRPEILDEMGLNAAVKSLAEQIQEDESIAVSYRHAGNEDRMRAEVETSLYRIIQESMKNVVEHSGANKVTLRINQKHNKVSISIQDNGKGFDTKEVLEGGKSGVGLLDMRIRAESMGGSLTVFSSRGAGTIIKLEVPV